MRSDIQSTTDERENPVVVLNVVDAVAIIVSKFVSLADIGYLYTVAPDGFLTLNQVALKDRTFCASLRISLSSANKSRSKQTFSPT